MWASAVLRLLLHFMPTAKQTPPLSSLQRQHHCHKGCCHCMRYSTHSRLTVLWGVVCWSQGILHPTVGTRNKTGVVGFWSQELWFLFRNSRLLGCIPSSESLLLMCGSTHKLNIYGVSHTLSLYLYRLRWAKFWTSPSDTAAQQLFAATTLLIIQTLQLMLDFTFG